MSEISFNEGSGPEKLSASAAASLGNTSPTVRWLMKCGVKDENAARYLLISLSVFLLGAAVFIVYLTFFPSNDSPRAQEIQMLRERGLEGKELFDALRAQRESNN